MNLVTDHLLSVILFFPAIAGLSLFVLPWSDRGARSFSLTVSVICAALTLWLWSLFEAGSSEMQFEESLEWIPSFGIRYSVGVDGVSLLMVALTTLLSLIVVLLSFSSGQARVREYLGCALVLQTGLFGSFLATDLFLFYVFCEFILIPVYFLIGVWGGSHRVAATLKFALHSVTGSLLLLVAIVYAVWSVRDSGSISFDIAELTSRLRATELGTAEVWLFLGFATAFAIKVPIFPFHTWFPEAQVDASTGGAVILGGAVVQIGCYGFLRFALSMFPRASLALLPAIATLAVVGIVYGALVAMVQTDIRKLIAYASMSQIGFVVLGLSSMTVVGVSGGVVQMLNHGVSLCGLLVLAGILLERGQSLDLDACGGLAYLMPRYATAFVLVMLSAVGLPGLNGFIGKFMILVGMFSSQGMIVGASVAEFAAFACALAGVLGVGAVILVSLAVGRLHPRTEIGTATKTIAILTTLVLAAALLFPPVDDFQGGLLLWPLNDFLMRNDDFSEISALLAVVATFGCMLTAGYLIALTRQLLLGPIRHEERRPLSDLSVREIIVLLPVALVVVGIGVHPQPLLDVVNPAAERYTSGYRRAAQLPSLNGSGRRRMAPVDRPRTLRQGGIGAERGAEIQRRLPYRELRNRRRPGAEERQPARSAR